jgi:hypothetical protein
MAAAGPVRPPVTTPRRNTGGSAIRGDMGAYKKITLELTDMKGQTLRLWFAVDKAYDPRKVADGGGWWAIDKGKIKFDSGYFYFYQGNLHLRNKKDEGGGILLERVRDGRLGTIRKGGRGSLGGGTWVLTFFEGDVLWEKIDERDM